MGYIKHHAIIVTGECGNYIHKAHQEATHIGLAVSNIVTSEVNGCKSFFVAPDGSKEGWDASKDGDCKRGQFIEYLETLKHEDGSGPLAWAEIQYGDDNLQTMLVNDSDSQRRM